MANPVLGVVISARVRIGGVGRDFQVGVWGARGLPASPRAVIYRFRREII